MIVTEGWNANDALDAGDKKAIALKDRIGWLREWENAQRQQRQQVGGQSTGSEEPQDWTTREALIKPDSRSQPASQTQAADARRPAAAVGEESTGLKLAANGGAISETRQGATEGNVLGPVSPFSRPLDGTGALMPANGQRTTWFVRMSTWQPFVYQVVRSAAGVRVWIRDARLDASSGSGILNALRSQLACIGMTLASVTINGKAVWEAPADDRCSEASGGDPESVSLVNQLY